MSFFANAQNDEPEKTDVPNSPLAKKIALVATRPAVSARSMRGPKVTDLT